MNLKFKIPAPVRVHAHRSSRGISSHLYSSSSSCAYQDDTDDEGQGGVRRGPVFTRLRPGEEGFDDYTDDVGDHFARAEGEVEVKEEDDEYSYEAVTAAAYRDEENLAQLHGDINDEAMEEERQQFDLSVQRSGRALPPTISGGYPKSRARARGSNSRSDEESEESNEYESDESDADESDAEADQFVRDAMRYHDRPGRSSGSWRAARSRTDTVIAEFPEEESDKVRYVRMRFVSYRMPRSYLLCAFYKLNSTTLQLTTYYIAPPFLLSTCIQYQIKGAQPFR